MDTLGCTEGWLVIFDQRKKTLWKDKIYQKKETKDGMTVTVTGM